MEALKITQRERRTGEEIGSQYLREKFLQVHISDSLFGNHILSEGFDSAFPDIHTTSYRYDSARTLTVKGGFPVTLLSNQKNRIYCLLPFGCSLPIPAGNAMIMDVCVMPFTETIYFCPLIFSQ